MINKDFIQQSLNYPYLPPPSFFVFLNGSLSVRLRRDGLFLSLPSSVPIAPDGFICGSSSSLLTLSRLMARRKRPNVFLAESLKLPTRSDREVFESLRCLLPARSLKRKYTLLFTLLIIWTWLPIYSDWSQSLPDKSHHQFQEHKNDLDLPHFDFY